MIEINGIIRWLSDESYVIKHLEKSRVFGGFFYLSSPNIFILTLKYYKTSLNTNTIICINLQTCYNTCIVHSFSYSMYDD